MAPDLVAELKPPRCDLKARDAYPPGDLEVERKCLVTAESAARTKHSALASAVRVREAAAHEVEKGARTP